MIPHGTPHFGHSQPLDVRWREATAKLRTLTRGLHPALSGPMSEGGLGVVQQAIRALTPVTPENPAVDRATDELLEYRRRYERAWFELREIQREVGRVSGRKAHAILQDIPADWAEFPDRIGSPGDIPDFKTATEARA